MYDNMDVAGKVALVTGGASGIGKSIIEILLQKDAKVIYLVDTNESESKKVQEEFHKKYGDGKVRLCICDVTSMEQMEACFKDVKSTCGELHIVCNNAGILNEIKWQRMLEINLNGVIIGTKLAVQYMDGYTSGGGVIINTASAAGLLFPPFSPVYSTSKYATIGFTRTVAVFDPEVIKKKLRVNVLCPGAVDTPLVQKHIVAEAQYQKYLDDMFEKAKPHTQPHHLAEQFLKLIEEPHHGQTMCVAGAGDSSMIEDETKVFREKSGVEDMYREAVKNAAVE